MHWKPTNTNSNSKMHDHDFKEILNRTVLQCNAVEKNRPKRIFDFRANVLTSWVPAEEKFPDLIINKDEKTIGKSTKPPGRPVGETKEQQALRIKPS